MLWQTLDPLFPLILSLIVIGIVAVSLYRTERLLRSAYFFSAGCGTVAGAMGLIILLFLAQAFFVDRSRDIEAVEFFFMYLVAPVGAILGLMIASAYVLVDELYYEKARKVLLIGGLSILLVYIPYFVATLLPRGISRLSEIDDVGIYVAYLLFGLLPILSLVGIWRWVAQKRSV